VLLDFLEVSTPKKDSSEEKVLTNFLPYFLFYIIKMNVPGIYIYRRIVKAKLYIDTHFAEDLNLDKIAGEAYFSKFHFIRLFKKIYHLTPHQYLIKVRMEKAMEMLKTTVQINDVCFSIGFESAASFTSLFKQYTGLTPSAFQLAQLNRYSEIQNKPLQFIPGCFAKNQQLLVGIN
jgi:AraC-like DNA-binding protein